MYQAVDATAGRRLAVKVVDERYAPLIRHEAAMTQRLRHPHVPKIFDVGVLTGNEGIFAGYLAMELLSGEQLTRTLRRGPMPCAEAIRVAGTAADVLAVAHRRGVVHCDLTPANVMLTTGGPKVVDFGLARLIDGESRSADDVYALGALLFQMLTGRSAYPSVSRRPGPRSAAALRCLAPTPVLAVPGVPAELSELCRACMNKNAQGRPTAREAALRLWSLVQGKV